MLSDLDFEANARDGLAHLPDGPFLPPMAMNCVETHVAERIRASFPGERLMTIGRVAVLTAPHTGRMTLRPYSYRPAPDRGCGHWQGVWRSRHRRVDPRLA